MSTKVKHNTNRTSVKLAVLLTAGLIGSALIPGGAWADPPANPPVNLDAVGCNAIKGKDVVVFSVDRDGNVKDYFGSKNPAAPGKPMKMPDPFSIHLKKTVSIGVSVGNPVYCYTLAGERICVTY